MWFRDMRCYNDFLSKCITPLQDRSRLVWLYTEVNDTTRLERGDMSTLDDAVLAFMLGRLNPDLTSHDFLTPPVS
jgi:hypothetical protein